MVLPDKAPHDSIIRTMSLSCWITEARIQTQIRICVTFCLYTTTKVRQTFLYRLRIFTTLYNPSYCHRTILKCHSRYLKYITTICSYNMPTLCFYLAYLTVVYQLLKLLTHSYLTAYVSWEWHKRKRLVG